MALILKNKLYGNIKIDSNKIIGFMGNNYLNYMNMISFSNAYLIDKEYVFYTNNIDSEISLYLKNKDNSHKIKNIVLKEFNLDIDFLNKNISDLSSGEKHLLKYLIAFIINKKIIIIDEPFLDMDYSLKKKIKSLLQRIIYDTNKTIIIGSMDSNIIYELCDNILLLDNTYYYGKKIDVFTNKLLLENYKIDTPDIVEFINLVKKKNVLIDYSYDIRDLIKDVYKSV